MKIFVQKFRLARNWSLADLSQKSGVSSSHINDIENGIKNPTIQVLCKLAKALGVPCSELFDCDE